jgi:hypothetical protein
MSQWWEYRGVITPDESTHTPQALARLFGLFFGYPWFLGILASTMAVRLDDAEVIDAVVCMVDGPRTRA